MKDTISTPPNIHVHAVTPAPTTELIYEHAAFMRGVLQRVLKESIATEDTTDTCAYACVLLSVSLAKFMGVNVQFQGGGGGMDGGYVDVAGVPRGHYWLKATSPAGESWVVDITADQFGGPAVVVEPIASASGIYLPGKQDVVDLGMADLIAEMHQELRAT